MTMNVMIQITIIMDWMTSIDVCTVVISAETNICLDD